MQASAPGSCGELVQGLLDGQNFLITCPISWYSSVSVELDSTNEQCAQVAFRKTKLAIEKTLEYFKQDRKFSFTIESKLPHGKGMASSSADIAAACVATARALRQEISPKAIEQIALSIEPTDGIFYKGIVAFGHLSGQPNEHLGRAFPLKIAIFDTGSGVDTLSFNKRPELQVLNKQNSPQIQRAYELVKLGFQTNDPKLIGQGATLSAFTNQNILPKPHLEQIRDIALANGALGINVAHSGTVVGLLFEQLPADRMKACQSAILELDNNISFLGVADLVNGGVL